MIKSYRLIVFLSCFILLQTTGLYSHSYQVPLVVDTDMALDDARALVMLLNQEVGKVTLIVTGDGAVSPQKGCRNLERLLALLARGDIGLAQGRGLHKKAPPWRTWSEKIFSQPGQQAPKSREAFPAAAQALVQVIGAADTPYVYLCLGPLTNLADALKKEASIKEKISRLIYYGTEPGAPRPDWNTARDPDSARLVFTSGIRIFALSHPGSQDLSFDQELFGKITAMDSPASRLVVELHQLPAVEKLLAGGHFRIWDELTVIYLNYPELFQFSQKRAGIFTLDSYKSADIYKSYLKLLGYGADSHLKERAVVVLAAFPIDASMFQPDVAPSVKKIIEKYGLEEWKACVLTNELHRHLGIYSIVGAKMGIRAREVLEAPLDSLRVISFAGKEPPMSCLNDGLQVATGASLGRGTIEISASSPRPKATFIYRSNKLTLELKAEIVQKIKRDIQAALEKYGNLTPEYFDYVRKLSIRCWYELNRVQIFDTVAAPGSDLSLN